MLQNEFLSPIVLSLKVASISVTIVFILGIMIGKIFARKQFKGKTLIETILLLPIVLPPTVIGFLLIFIFGTNSPLGLFIERLIAQPIIFTFTAAVIASTIVAFPLMYQTVKIGFQAVDIGIEEAARIDGAGELKVFLHITLPLSIKSIIAGLVLSFARSLGEFGATFMFAGNIPGKTQTAPTAIYIAMESGNMNLAWLLVATMVIISFFFILITTVTQK
ncbi:molybdate transport system permease protein [Bacillus sp. SORGH_AS 510]|uniref:molybdate ABC transporter permease subunit n=1 Tax=Bacillus sp. SORGH_AS_0510 TaxID=3041771 RepID=UPI0027822FD2|nr:molybdate ABC transporter permease subunit [Bacillus sp. SORGH_AS_0510]MDQ1145473.1 molybdate transport system permease protein [Bacillus sp. SORGH_AS_0510]